MVKHGHAGPRRPKVCQVNGRTVLEHRLVWEKHHGPIPDGMHVHHINGDERDNRIENLQLVTPAEHRHIHAGYELREGVWWKRCRTCGETKPLSEFYRYPYYPFDGAIPYCKPCHRKACREQQRTRRDRRRSLNAAVLAVPGGCQGDTVCNVGIPFAGGDSGATGTNVGV